MFIHADILDRFRCFKSCARRLDITRKQPLKIQKNELIRNGNSKNLLMDKVNPADKGNWKIPPMMY